MERQIIVQNYTSKHTYTYFIEPPNRERLEMLYDFEAQDRAEFSVSAGQMMTPLYVHDRIGCREWWLVGSDR